MIAMGFWKNKYLWFICNCLIIINTYMVLSNYFYSNNNIHLLEHFYKVSSIPV